MSHGNTPEVEKFLADARAFPWEIFHMVTLDGSFFPPSTDLEVLNAAVRRLGCAGFIGIVKDSEGIEATPMIRPYGVETPGATAALDAALHAITSAAVGKFDA